MYRRQHIALAALLGGAGAAGLLLTRDARRDFSPGAWTYTALGLLLMAGFGTLLLYDNGVDDIPWYLYPVLSVGNGLWMYDRRRRSGTAPATSDQPLGVSWWVLMITVFAAQLLTAALSVVLYLMLGTPVGPSCF